MILELVSSAAQGVQHDSVCAHTQTSTAHLIPHTKTTPNHRFGQLPLLYTYFCARIIPTLPHPTSFHFLPCTVVSRLVIGSPTAHVSDVIYHVKDMRSAALSRKHAIRTSCSWLKICYCHVWFSLVPCWNAHRCFSTQNRGRITSVVIRSGTHLSIRSSFASCVVPLTKRGLAPCTFMSAN